MGTDSRHLVGALHVTCGYRAIVEDLHFRVAGLGSFHNVFPCRLRRNTAAIVRIPCSLRIIRALPPSFGPRDVKQKPRQKHSPTSLYKVVDSAEAKLDIHWWFIPLRIRHAGAGYPPGSPRLM